MVDASIAPVFLAALTLITSMALPLLFVCCSRILAVFGSAMRDVRIRLRNRDEDAGQVGNAPSPRSLTHLPVLLANGGSWVTDAWAGLNLSLRNMKEKKWRLSLIYVAVFGFSVIALLIGPIAAFLISREALFGFGSQLAGPCLHQINFTINATNVFSNITGLALDHHWRAIELLPWLSTFKYP